VLALFFVPAILLGVVTPLIISRIEHRVGPGRIGRRAAVARVAGGLGAGSLVMASVLLMVFVLPWAGVALFAATVLVVLVIPFALTARRTVALPDVAGPAPSDPLAAPVGRVVAGLARRPGIVLPIAVAVTTVAAVFAFSVPTEFDVEDFFSSDSDFVVALDLVDTHVGERGGEPAQIYVEADLAMKENALKRLDDLAPKPVRFRAPDRLLAFLEGL